MKQLREVRLFWSDGFSLSIIDPKIVGSAELEVIQTASPSIHIDPSNGPLAAPVPSLMFKPDDDLVFFPCRLKEFGEYDLIVTLPISKSECIERAQRASSVWPFDDSRLTAYLRVTAPRLWIEETKNETLIGAFFTPRMHPGVVNLSTLDHSVFVEVMSAKIDYETDFKTLLVQIAEEHLRLIYSIDQISSTHLYGRVTGNEDSATLLFHLRYIMQNDVLPEAVETILSNPGSDIAQQIDWIPTGQMSSSDVRTIAKYDLSAGSIQGGPFRRLFAGRSPRKLPVQTKRETKDTAENRYIKAFLEDIYIVVTRLEERLGNSGHLATQTQVKNWADKIIDWLTAPFWREVGQLTFFPSNSQRLQRNVGYRDVLDCDLRLKTALTLPWSAVEQLKNIPALGDIRPITELYEYWCFLVILRVLRELYGPEVSAHTLISDDDNGFELKLARGTTSQICFNVSHSGKQGEIRLFFNRSFPHEQNDEWGSWSGSYSTLLHPDITIAVLLNGQAHCFHFDAKYRLDLEKWQGSFELSNNDKQSEELGVYKKADLYKMHSYRDAILGSRGSYVLYPGKQLGAAGADVYVRRSWSKVPVADIPGVGAFALCPGHLDGQIDNVKQFLERNIGKIYEAPGYLEEEGLA